MKNFIPGLKLSELFYSEAAKPIIAEDVSNYFGRPYLIFDSFDLIPDILNSFTDDEVKAIKHGLGSVNQFIDTTDQLSRLPLVEILKAVYK
jgi:hypothetical protein